ncbi:MAG: hypothetical protein AAF700_03355 [Pseudomonadota bacterium]
MVSRRDFLRSSGSLAAVSALGGLAACSAPLSSSNSYINGVIAPGRNTTVFTWTDIMLQAIRNQSVPPPPATRSFAMAHVAGFTAVNAIKPRYDDALQVGPGPTGADLDAAYASAFATALGESLRASFAPDLRRFLSSRPSGEATRAGAEWGRRVGQALIKARAQDGSEPSRATLYLGRYPRRDGILKWSPTGPFYDAGSGPGFATFARGLLPGWGDVTPWVMRSKAQFLAVDFPEAGSAEFARQLEKVRRLGASDSAIRTADERQIAFFWEDGPRGVTPPGHWQIIAMDILQRRNLDIVDQARAFALLSMGQADAAVTTWHSKYTHDIVRPETFIRQRAANRDPGWKTLIPTPGFPAYTSGHSTFSAVSARMLARLIGTDRVNFSSTAPDLVNWPVELTGVRRSWSSLSQAADEGGASREFGGIHWEADNVEGLRVGRDLADFTFANLLKTRV